MKYLVTIILSLSLYAPQVAKWMAYVECTALAVTMADKSWCDCMLSSDTDVDGIPATEKQKDIQFKTDWKFTIEKNISAEEAVIAAIVPQNGFYTDHLPTPYKPLIFHPPLV